MYPVAWRSQRAEVSAQDVAMESVHQQTPARSPPCQVERNTGQAAERACLGRVRVQNIGLLSR